MLLQLSIFGVQVSWLNIDVDESVGIRIIFLDTVTKLLMSFRSDGFHVHEAPSITSPSTPSPSRSTCHSTRLNLPSTFPSHAKHQHQSMISSKGFLLKHRTFIIGINFTSRTPIKMSDQDSDSETPLLRESIADILAGAYRAVSGKAVETTVTEEERPDTASSAESSDTIRPSQPGSATTVRRRSASVVTGPPIIGGESAGDGADSEERRGLTFEESAARDESAGDPSPAVDISTAQPDEPTTNPGGSGTPPNQVTFWGSPDLSDLATGTEIDSTLVSAGLMVPQHQK